MLIIPIPTPSAFHVESVYEYSVPKFAFSSVTTQSIKRRKFPNRKRACQPGLDHRLFRNCLEPAFLRHESREVLACRIAKRFRARASHAPEIPPARSFLPNGSQPFGPVNQPTADVPPARYRRQDVDIGQNVGVHHSLKKTKSQPGAADSASGEGHKKTFVERSPGRATRALFSYQRPLDSHLALQRLLNRPDLCEQLPRIELRAKQKLQRVFGVVYSLGVK